MAQLLANLRSENLNRDVKPDILLVRLSLHGVHGVHGRAVYATEPLSLL